MMENYLQIMLDSLKKKSEILAAVEEKSNEQAAMLGQEDLTVEQIDRNMNEKAELIRQITSMDKGFDTLYENVRKELLENKDLYKDKIAKLQEQISHITEQSASIEAIEARNKAAVEEWFKNQRKGLANQRNVSDVAYHYYKTANKINLVNPQFMDQKK